MKANQIYNKLVKQDFENKKFPYIKAVCQMGVAIHEAKHLVDNIEHPELNQTTKKLWELAIRSFDDQSYTRENLRSDLLDLYENYRTIREHASFESLDIFEQSIVSGLNRFYQK